MVAKLVGIEQNKCTSCGTLATHALEVDGMFKGFYCAGCGGVLVKKDPDNIKAHRELDKVGTFRRLAPKAKKAETKELPVKVEVKVPIEHKVEAKAEVKTEKTVTTEKVVTKPEVKK